MDFSFGEDLPATETARGPEEEHIEVHLDSEQKGAREPEPVRSAPPTPKPVKPEPAPPPREPKPAPAPPAPKAPQPAAAPPGEKGFDFDFLGLSEEGDEDFFKLVEEEIYRQGGFGEEAIKDIGPQIELLSFEIGRETYAIPLTSIQQIIKMKNITMVPRAPDFIAGVLSLRGMVLPVFDLRKRLGLESTPATRETRIIVVMVNGTSCGLIVDRVKQVVRIPEDSLEEPPAILGGVEAEFLEGIGRHDHKMLIILNLGKVTDISSQVEKGKAA